MVDLFTASARYVVDTCSFTEMKRRYPRDVFPSAWDKLEALAEAGVFVSLDEVLDELSFEDDEVLAWAVEHGSVFLPLDDDIQLAAKEILKSFPKLLNMKKKKSSADAFVVGAAKAYGYTVVTEEKPSGGPDRPKIPDVCRAIAVQCIGVLEMLRREGLRL